MATLTGHAYVAALRSLGLEFSLYPGWEQRGTFGKPFTPVAPVLHWDASNPGVDLRKYIADRNLAGWYASRGAASELVCLSTTRTGHIGQGDMGIVQSLRNRRPVPWATNPERGDGYPYQWYWGLEMANRGAPAEPWHPNLVRNGARWAAAHCLMLGVDPDITISHLVSTRRKIDIGLVDSLATGGRFNWRTEIRRHWNDMNGTFNPALPTPPDEVDDMPTPAEYAEAVHTRLAQPDSVYGKVDRQHVQTRKEAREHREALEAAIATAEASITATVVAQVGPVVAAALQAALAGVTVTADIDAQAVADTVTATLAARLAGGTADNAPETAT